MKSADSQIPEVAGYRLTSLIGSGGMGDVYKGYHSLLNRYAAIKILHLKEAAERFKNEAYIQASINHPNIAKLYEFTAVGNQSCIIMEYVEGETLDALIQKKRKLPDDETENIVSQIASALAYLHKKQIMHRDIKPSNFKIQPDGVVKMLDFGIAKNKYSPKLTQLGFVVGTLEYIAPEQFQQQPQLKSDVWSLAVMTYEMITGYLPFEADNPAVLRTKIMKGTYTDPKLLSPGISQSLQSLVEKGLKVHPAERISAAEAEKLFEKKKQATIPVNKLAEIFKNKKRFLITGIIVLALGLIVISRIGGDKENTIPIVPEMDDENSKKSIMINVLGIENAEIIFDNNTRQTLPYPVKGKEGEKVQFTIHADGYQDKKVQIEITSRRDAYEFSLDKINN
jgi:serine/threonine-protein kinase